MSLRVRIKRVISEESGFTLIEVVIAAFILAVGALAVFLTLVAAIHNVQRGRETQVASSIAQREMEKIRVLPYEQIVMVSAPAAATEAERTEGSPKARISGTEYALKRDGTEKAPLAVAGSGVCTEKLCVNNQAASSCVGGSSPGTFNLSGSIGSVYCYVTTVKDTACEAAISKVCTFKRIVVDVWLTKRSNLGNRPTYYELQASVTNPSP